MADQAFTDLRNIEYAATVDLFLSLRDTRTFDGVISLFDRMPGELAETRLIREHYAFALSRTGQAERAATVLEDVLGIWGPDSTTYGLLGRVYKDRWDLAKQNSAADAEELLQRAIDVYATAFSADSGNSYLGINAVSLMEMQRSPDPRQGQMLPGVRKAARRTLGLMQSKGDSGRNYWDHASLLELAVLARDFVDAEQCLNHALAAVQASWEAESTARNLSLIRKVREQRGENTAAIAGIEADLKKAAEQIQPKENL
jgi:hypothetical protein